jgi:hypothetical protein
VCVCEEVGVVRYRAQDSSMSVQVVESSWTKWKGGRGRLKVTRGGKQQLAV